MAIQIPNVGTGNAADQSGDNEWLAMKKVADNFSDQSNAASRLVGRGDNNIPLNTDVVFAALTGKNEDSVTDADLYSNGSRNLTGEHANIPSSQGIGGYIWYIDTISQFGQTNQLARSHSSLEFCMRNGSGGVWTKWHRFLTTVNTTRDSNGFIKAASPIVRVFADKIECNDDAQSQNIEYIKNGVGDYTLKNSSGLSKDGWYIELPKDINGNPKVAVTLKEIDGVITLKSFKRIFSMETFSFIPDLDSPIDIPNDRWIDLRLNDVEKELPKMPLDKTSEV